MSSTIGYDGISNLAGIMQRQQQTSSLQTQITQLETEASTGLLANPAVQMGAQISTFYELQTQASTATAVQTAATTVGNRLNSMQTALTGINSLVGTVATQALGVDTTVGTDSYGTVATQATGSMDQMLSMMNTTYDGQFLFSGNDSGTQAMTPSSSGPMSALNTMLSSAVSSNGGTALNSSTVSSLETQINNMFSDSNASPSQNYTGVFFTATDNGKPVTTSIGGSSTISYDMKGNNQGFRDVLKGMSMMALLNSPSSQLDDSAKQQLLTDAVQSINLGQSELTRSTANVGAVQSQLQSVADNQQAAADATNVQISTMDTADPYKTATELSALQTQLQATYEITASISKLSFVNYMP